MPKEFDIYIYILDLFRCLVTKKSLLGADFSGFSAFGPIISYMIQLSIIIAISITIIIYTIIIFIYIYTYVTDIHISIYCI